MAVQHRLSPSSADDVSCTREGCGLIVADEAVPLLDRVSCPERSCVHGSNPGPCVVVAAEGAAVCSYCGRCFTWCEDGDRPHSHGV